MIKISKQVHGIPMITVWYADKKIDDKGLICYKESICKIGDAVEFITLFNDLTEDADAIKGHFTSNCRNQVGRAYREGSVHSIVGSDEIKDCDIEEFITFFEEFWKSKDSCLSNPESLKDDLKNYRDKGALTISKGIVNGETCVYHTYLCDDTNARLFHSASLFRLIEGEDNGAIRQMIGRANRMLHYEDMLYFKNKGLKVYDWGGAGKEEEVASITKFKESFGGKEVILYESNTCEGFKAGIVSTLSGIKRRIKG